jgi:hypothetical protein
MSKKLSDIVSGNDVAILRDVYVYKLPADVIESKHNISSFRIQRVVDVIAKDFIYEARKLNSRMSSKEVMFDESEIEKCVWQDFIASEVEDGKNTLKIAAEVGVPLQVVNSYY